MQRSNEFRTKRRGRTNKHWRGATLSFNPTPTQYPMHRPSSIIVQKRRPIITSSPATVQRRFYRFSVYIQNQHLSCLCLLFSLFFAALSFVFRCVLCDVRFQKQKPSYYLRPSTESPGFRNLLSAVAGEPGDTGTTMNRDSASAFSSSVSVMHVSDRNPDDSLLVSLVPVVCPPRNHTGCKGCLPQKRNTCSNKSTDNKEKQLNPPKRAMNCSYLYIIFSYPNPHHIHI